jgi:hypothetical protein
MAFDASVIADIGSNTPDPAGAQQKALTLADLYDQNKLNKIKVGDAKQSQSDMTYAKQILQGKDLSKLEDQNAAVAEITKRSPKLGMELARDFSTQRKDKAGEQMDQLEYYKAKNEILGSDLMQLKAKHDQIIQDFQAKNPKATPQQLEQATHDAMQKDVIEWVQRLSSQTLPNGQPLINEQDKQTIKSGLGQGYSSAWVDSMVNKSATARQEIATKLKERDEARKEKATDASIASGGRRADQGDRRLDQTDRKISDQEKAAALKVKMSEGGKFTEEDASWLAEQYIAGDKSVMVGLGRGAQGPQNIIMVRHAIASEAKAQGMKPADLAARLAEYTGFVSEQRALGTQQANVEMASSEAQQMIQNARGASDDTAVSRAHALGWNKIEQWTEKQVQDPKLASLKAATTAVVNTWARAINPKGVATVSDKEHGYELLNQAQDKATYDAVLDRFQQETEASLAAPASAKSRLHDAFMSGLAPTAAAAPGPGSLQATPGRGAPAAGGAAPLPGAPPAPDAAPAAPGGAPVPAAAGAVMKFDAQGNQIG